MVFVTSKSKRIHIHMAIYQKGLETMINPVSVTLLVSILYFLNTNGSEKKKKQRSLKKLMILDLEQEMYKMSLKYFIILESKDANRCYRFLVEEFGKQAE